MSQVSIIDIEGNHPEIPTEFVANIGSAVPIGNILEILGDVVPAGILPVYTSASGNTVVVNVQISQAIASSNVNNIGLSAFNSAHFSVDGNGFVSLLGGGQAIDQIAVQANTAPGVNPVNPDANGLMTVNGNLVVAHGVPIETRSRSLNSYNIEPQISSVQAGSTITANGMSHYDSARFTIDASGFVSSSPTGLIQTLTPDEDFDGSAATPIAPQGGTIIVSGSTLAAATVTETYNSNGLSTGNLEIEHRAWTTPFVVDSSTTPGARGTFSTFATAMAAAASGQTLFLRTGTYSVGTQALKPGVNIVAYDADGLTPNVIIEGNLTLSAAGTVSISGVHLMTDGGAFLTVSGSAASNVNLKDCGLSCTDGTGIVFSSSSANASIDIENCHGDISATGIALFDHSSAGTLSLLYTLMDNSGGSTTANTASAGQLVMRQSRLTNPLTTSGTNIVSAMTHSIINTDSQNVTAFTPGGTSASVIHSIFISGTASAISVGTSLFIRHCDIQSTNTNAISGGGAIISADLTFNSSSQINTTTQSASILRPGISRSTHQPAFLATANAQANVTGDGSTYVILFANVIFDQNNNFTSPTFTAPFTGRYQFNVTLELGGLGVANTSGSLTLVTSNRSIILATYNWGVIQNVANTVRVAGSALVDMDAADTASVTIQINGGALVVDVGATNTTFSGFMVC